MLTIGKVLHLFCKTTTPPKPKYLVVACCEPELRLFYVNSEISKFDQKNPCLNICNVTLLKSRELDFPKHDSYIRCCDVNSEFTVNEIIENSMSGGNDINVMVLGNNILEEMLAAVKVAPLISKEEKMWIINSIDEKVNMGKS